MTPLGWAWNRVGTQQASSFHLPTAAIAQKVKKCERGRLRRYSLEGVLSGEVEIAVEWVKVTLVLTRAVPVRHLM